MLVFVVIPENQVVFGIFGENFLLFLAGLEGFECASERV